MRSGLQFVLLMACTAPAWAAELCCADGAQLEQITNRMSASAAQRRANLEEYSVTRRYTLRNERWGKEAEMAVRVSFRKGVGKSYQVLERHGSEGLSRKVLDRLVEEEMEDSRPGKPDEGRLDSTKYDFKFAGTEVRGGRLCYVLDLYPKTHNKHLLDGKAWVDASDFSLVRLEGRPAASLGFWAGRPLITQEYKNIGGVSMPTCNRSVSESHFLGVTELVIESTDYDIRTGVQDLARR